ncbi:MAG: alanyl-tRNA editing protein [Candidatus Krumholzibacteria bacterium]|nr:alanyl-tRNA editing protein [Candidatus Krumholzibacteria bacterium]
MDKISATRKLYLRDPYTVSFEATLVSSVKMPEGRYAAVLDQTFFYPASGGQLADRGTIEDAEVVDVWEDDAGIVYHGLTADLPSGSVRCQVDWERRFDHMQQHTGQHILSRAFIETGHMETVSFHMGDEMCTIDIDGAQLDSPIVASAEALANAVLWQDREVLVSEVSASELDVVELRKKLPEGVEKVRLVEIAGFDVIGCCGTHVGRTGELGIIKILKHEKSRGAYRVTFQVGRRAFDDLGAKHELVKQLANRFTTSVDGLEEKIRKVHSQGQQYRKELQRLSRRLATYEARDLLDKARDHGGQTYVVEVVGDCSESHLRLLATELKNQNDVVSMIASDSGVVICHAPDDAHIDFSDSVVERAKSLAGSGGGKGGFATVRLPAGVAVREFIEQAFEVVVAK